MKAYLNLRPGRNEKEWLAEQEVRGSIPGLAATISETGYLLLLNRDMAERSLKKTTNQPKRNENDVNDHDLSVCVN